MAILDTDNAATFAAVIEIWNGAEPTSIRRLITDDYRGHMLHLADGDRDADEYAERIARYRRENPGVRFDIVDQCADADRVWSRLVATRSDGTTAHGMNVSRMVQGRIAEEWAIWSAWSE